MRYVARAEAKVGWRVYDNKSKQCWGNYFQQYPEELLAELNGPKRPERLVELCRISYAKKEKE